MRMQPYFIESTRQLTDQSQPAGGTIGRISPVEQSAERTGLSAVIDFVQLPHALLATRSTSPVTYELTPTNPGLLKLVSPFLSKDGLRPAMTGVLFDSFGVIATDGHRLVMMPDRSGKVRGLFVEQGTKKIDERYPDYPGAIPTPAMFTFSGPVNVRALRSYVQGVLPFVNQITHAIPFIVEDGNYIGFNGKLLIETLLFFERLGVATAHIHISRSDRAAVLSVENHFDFQRIEQPAMLLMPILIYDPHGDKDKPIVQFPYNLDLYTGVRAVWHFGKNTVLDATYPDRAFFFDAKTATWNYPATISDKLPAHVFADLAKTLRAKPIVPIAELVLKTGEYLVATGDGKSFYTYHQAIVGRMPNGMYRLVAKKALVPEEGDPADYLKLPAGLLTEADSAPAPVETVELRAMALLIIQRQRLRLVGQNLSGVRAPFSYGYQLELPGLGGLGELPDGEYAPAYARVRHLLSDTDRKAYDYYFNETADFTDFSSLNRGDELSADWHRHKQVVEQALRQLSRDGAVSDGYSQGRNFVGRHQKQTADLDIAQIAKLVRQELAATFPDGKFSVRIDRYAGGQSLSVDIVDLPFDPFSEQYSQYLREAKTMGSWLNWQEVHYDQYQRVPIYNEQALSLQDRIKKMVEQYNYDNSDPMTDYFHVRFYGHVQLVERNFLLKYYPDSLDAGHYKHWEAKFAAQKKASDERAASRKGKFKTGSLVYYTLKTGRPERKGYLPDGAYLANVIKSPNGRGSFSSYTLQLLRSIEEAKPNDAEFARNMDARKPGQFLHAHRGQVYIKDSRWRLLEHVGEDRLSPSDAPAEPVTTASDESVALRAKALLLIQRQRLRLL